MAALVTEFDFTYLTSIFLVGVLLHQVFLLTSNLWANAALHTGWVFTIKAVGGGFETSSPRMPSPVRHVSPRLLSYSRSHRFLARSSLGNCGPKQRL